MSNYSDRIPETTGHIASDSLAAESLRGNSGGFASNEPERGVAPSSQPARGNTARNTDTSGAHQLDPAPYREARLTETQAQGKDYQTPAEIPGLDKFADSTYDTGSGGRSYDTSRGAPPQNLGEGPGHTAPFSEGASAGHIKPKGSNLQEVSTFENEERAPNASFQFTDIESKDDPARQAIRSFENANSRAAGDAGRPLAGKEGFEGGQGGYENLDSERGA